MKKFIEVIIGLSCALMLIWGIASYIDITMHNNPFSEDYQDFASWNIFRMIGD